MKLAACIVILALSAHTLFADDSDSKMPRVVREAKDTVEVFMRYSLRLGGASPIPPRACGWSMALSCSPISNCTQT